MKLILITGMPGSGKDELCKVAAQMGVSVVRMGYLVRAEALKRRIHFSDSNVGGFAASERHKHGFGIWAERTLKHLDGGLEIVLVNGIRCPEEVEVFRKGLPDSGVAVIALHSSPATRRERLMRRGRGDDVATDDEFAARDRRELEWGLGEVIACADEVLVNEGTLEELGANVRALIGRLTGAGR